MNGPSVTCAFTLFGNLLSPQTAKNVDVTLTAPSTVAAGTSADFTIKLGGNPGLSNGPVQFDNGAAIAWVALNGDQNNVVATPQVPLPPIAPNTPIPFPVMFGHHRSTDRLDQDRGGPGPVLQQLGRARLHHPVGGSGQRHRRSRGTDDHYHLEHAAG